MPGLIIAGRQVAVGGLAILNGNDFDWCRLHPDDYTMRRTTWVRGVVIHTTGGNWPQVVRPGAGIRGHAQRIAQMWSGADRGGGDRVHSGAHLEVDYDGTVACLADLQLHAAYHATTVNDHTIGIEMCTLPDGSIQQTTLDATVQLVVGEGGLCELFGIPPQVHVAPYRNAPIPRLVAGGRDAVGIYGHRDQSDQRGRGDPGDRVYELLVAEGAEPLDYATGEDLAKGRARQRALRVRGEQLMVDGLVGTASLAAARRQGFKRWADVPAP
jgi:hypothetical protein